MKKSIIITVLMAAMLPLAAQHSPKHRGERHRDVTELVSDLSATQKRKVETISKQSKERVGKMREQQKALRDSIMVYMDRDGDQSRVLFPLFDREARLQADISREMYRSKYQIDQILTPEQRSELRKACKKK